jgi:hypothetical protein
LPRRRVLPLGRKVGEIWEQDVHEILTRWYSVDGASPGRWREILNWKRADSYYPIVLESVKRYGLLVPLGCYAVWNGATSRSEYEMYFGDGHHRFAAVCDLGLETIPLRLGSEKRGDYWADHLDSAWSEETGFNPEELDKELLAV